MYFSCFSAALHLGKGGDFRDPPDPMGAVAGMQCRGLSTHIHTHTRRTRPPTHTESPPPKISPSKICRPRKRPPTPAAAGPRVLTIGATGTYVIDDEDEDAASKQACKQRPSSCGRDIQSSAAVSATRQDRLPFAHPQVARERRTASLQHGVQTGGSGGSFGRTLRRQRGERGSC